MMLAYRVCSLEKGKREKHQQEKLAWVEKVFFNNAGEQTCNAVFPIRRKIHTRGDKE
jgi:hypothetical protein